ncbi:MAG: zinc ABC transporter substrate-binding protein [Candidatus Bathyarchaeota archaeon]|nr:zinc ABC transporter substrate-binding protein [Candidatus Termiticorpusculum sp.]
MNHNQKILLAGIIIISLLVTTFIVYSSISTSSTKSSDKLKIVTTFYPLTYITQQIGGDYVEVTQLIPNNNEIHNWEPTVSHIRATEDADIIFYNGAGADSWMEDEILPALSNSKKRLNVETTEDLTLIANKEDKHNDDHDDDDDDDDHDTHDHGLYDPHTWVSPYMAKQQAEIIYNILISADPQHEEYYTQRWHTLERQLEQLDATYRNSLSNTHSNVIFVSHGAFGYLADQYGFTQHSVIGVSADEQPSAQTIIKLVEEMKEYKNYVLYVDPVYASNYVQTIQKEVQVQTGQNVTVLKLYLMLGPMDGLDYLEQMQTNLSNLQTGLAAK